MVGKQMMQHWSLRIPPEMMATLHDHLFPGDLDEHGAVIGASVVETARGTRLLARRLFLAADGVDYLPGQRGYRMLTASFVSDCVLDCDDEGLAYLAMHCHGGTDSVGFSADDMASHDRGYPALLDISDGRPVGGLVFAKNAVAGDIWLPNGDRVPLDCADIPSLPHARLTPRPIKPPLADALYDRQVRLFGDRGQAILAQQKVGIIGMGGVGSLINEYVARLGVGQIVGIDPDRIEASNQPRVVGATNRDLRPWLTHHRLPAILRRWGAKHRSPKVRMARRVALAANPAVRFTGHAASVVQPEVAAELLDCDFIFLAADTMQARLVFNAIVHQYLIPGIQVGAKVQLDPATGEILDVFSIVRPLLPGQGCLWCNGLISSAKLQEEATSADQARRQRYVDDDDVHAPSVLTLNAMGAARAVDFYMFNQLGIQEPQPLRWVSHDPRDGEVAYDLPRRDPGCRECERRLGAGSLLTLPTIQRSRRTRQVPIIQPKHKDKQP